MIAPRRTEHPTVRGKHPGALSQAVFASLTRLIRIDIFAIASTVNISAHRCATNSAPLLNHRLSSSRHRRSVRLAGVEAINYFVALFSRGGVVGVDDQSPFQIGQGLPRPPSDFQEVS